MKLSMARNKNHDEAQLDFIIDRRIRNMKSMEFIKDIFLFEETDCNFHKIMLQSTVHGFFPDLKHVLEIRSNSSRRRQVFFI